MSADEKIDWDEPDERIGKCPHCDGGWIAVERGSSLRYPCPDCSKVDKADE